MSSIRTGFTVGEVEELRAELRAAVDALRDIAYYSVMVDKFIFDRATAALIAHNAKHPEGE